MMSDLDALTGYINTCETPDYMELYKLSEACGGGAESEKLLNGDNEGGFKPTEFLPKPTPTPTDVRDASKFASIIEAIVNAE